MPEKDKAAIFDIDGTLMNDQNRRWMLPDWKSYVQESEFDKPNSVVHNLLDYYVSTGVRIVILTARDSAYRDLTRQVLDLYSITYSHLSMRPEGNHDHDAEVKAKLIDEICDAYNVIVAFDDKQSCVDEFVKRNIPTFQFYQSVTGDDLGMVELGI